MPQAFQLQQGPGQASLQSRAAQHAESLLDLQTPSSTLRQHLDPEALPRPDFFESLDDLHLWYQMHYGDSLNDGLEQCSNHTGPPSPLPSHSALSGPKLVVCHDFQGGYNEDPRQQGYSLEHLHLVDTFIYFSHKRVSIPPVGWLTAAARTGTKVLGTLIFEWSESVPDMARLLRGPERKAMPLRGEPCFSPQYAVELIELALQRGFSGYLVNIEVALDLGFSCSGEAWPAWVGEQARIVEMHRNAERLRGWLHYLREKGTRRFIEAGKDADEWEVMWYDSVVYPHGQLAWQDALNEHNVSFFQAAHTFFTNYTWARPPQPLPPGQLIDPNDDNPQILQLRGYGLTGPDDGGHHPQLLLSAAMVDSLDRPREDVCVGIDVFGRNCWGGLKTWKSLNMIGPHRQEQDRLGLSVALFAPGWTWEEESAGLTLQPSQASKKRRWADWWHIDSSFWIGLPSTPTSEQFRITLSPDEVKPLQSYFNRSNLRTNRGRRRASKDGFYTNFSFGSGTKWFDGGELVHDWSRGTDANAGFTDMGVCMPKSDLLYATAHDGSGTAGTSRSRQELLSWTFDHDRVWSGTASLQVTVAQKDREALDTARRMHIPLCSAVLEDCGENLENGKSDEWQYTIVYDGENRLQPLLALAETSNQARGIHVPVDGATHRNLPNGWTAATVSFRVVHSDRSQARECLTLSLGFTASVQPEASLHVRIGALQVSKQSAPTGKTALSMDVRPASDLANDATSDQGAKRLQASVLDWTASRDFCSSSYYNVWVQKVDRPESRVWLGTSTREATPYEFCQPDHLALPPQLAQEEEEETSLEYIVTSLDILDPRTVAKASVTLI
ncbi:Glycoside hydrolase [Pseudozyma hubeiensis]|nr:Glycoside hydrolase [Pseudozyma hubeiensis]